MTTALLYAEVLFLHRSLCEDFLFLFFFLRLMIDFEWSLEPESPDGTGSNRKKKDFRIPFPSRCLSSDPRGRGRRVPRSQARRQCLFRGFQRRRHVALRITRNPFQVSVVCIVLEVKLVDVVSRAIDDEARMFVMA